MWTGSVTDSHADNRHGVASQAGFAWLTLQHRVVRWRVTILLPTPQPCTTEWNGWVDEERRRNC